jgi:rSAM/selenodomain-associated transferase 1
MDKPIVFIFARAPRFGAVKTRLARDIGAAETLRFYRNTLHGVARRLASSGRLDVVLAVTPDRTAMETAYWPAGLARVAQGRGDLGLRMVRVLKCAGSRPAIVIGSDIPDASVALVLDAVRALGTSRFVLGPTQDGGYWLIGARHPASLSRRQLDSVRWSTPHALADTVAKLHDVSLLPQTLTDVDDGRDYSLIQSRQSLQQRVHV